MFKNKIRILSLLTVLTSFNAHALPWWKTEVPDYLNQTSLNAGVSSVKDIAYGANIKQTFDIYFSNQKLHDAPVLFLVHGGAWMSGDKASSQLMVNKINHWTKKGFIIVSVNYRLVPEASISEQVNDVARALTHAQTQVKTWGGSPDKFILMGHSSGAHVINLLSARSNEKIKPWLATISLDGAGFDIADIMRNKHQAYFDPVFGTDTKVWNNNSPTQQLIQKPSMNYLLICSSGSNVWTQQAKIFSDKVNYLGGKSNIFMTSLDHNQLNEQLGLDNPYTQYVDNYIENILK